MTSGEILTVVPGIIVVVCKEFIHEHHTHSTQGRKILIKMYISLFIRCWNMYLRMSVKK